MEKLVYSNLLSNTYSGNGVHKDTLIFLCCNQNSMVVSVKNGYYPFFC